MEVEVINIPLEEGSGSGMAMISPSESILATMPTSGANINDFRNLTTETIGQLYAYYYTNTSVVLGTRSADGSIASSDEDVQVAVGLSAIAEGVYVCKVENFPNRNDSGINEIFVDIQTKLRELHVL